ncbi:class II glutamine amidotransferase [Mycobacteroides abscessus]|uniref:class II glutamine amidotransferase n=1 Tax=Mycobacteroides abscessus TaxID=36809 RepID=UPI000C264EBB|nr:glucosamine 6-phosphate synthetase [Mycobacteroides abscessus]
MCILSYLPPGTPVDENGLLNGGIRNPHGHGWAIAVDDSYIVVGKSLDLMQALEEFAAARLLHPGGPALFHSRWATHGGVHVGNVHPFVVGGSHRTVVAHNGILPKAAHPVAGDDRSDTRKFADEMLSRQFRRLDRPKSLRALEHWCGKGNKLVILTVDPRYRCSAYLVNEAAGTWDQETGIWHSNSDYEDYPSWRSTRRYAWELPPMVSVSGEPCEVCNLGVADRQGYCEVCGSCQDCGEEAAGCLCWPCPAGVHAGASSR